MPYLLQTFRGYTVDIKLKQFRKVTKDLRIIFVDFDSPAGDKLLGDYISSLDIDKKQDYLILMKIINLF